MIFILMIVGVCTVGWIVALAIGLCMAAKHEDERMDRE